MPKTRALINLDPDEKERIHEIAKRESRSFSNFIVNAIREYNYIYLWCLHLFALMRKFNFLIFPHK